MYAMRGVSGRDKITLGLLKEIGSNEEPTAGE